MQSMTGKPVSNIGFRGNNRPSSIGNMGYLITNCIKIAIFTSSSIEYFIPHRQPGLKFGIIHENERSLIGS